MTKTIPHRIHLLFIFIINSIFSSSVIASADKGLINGKLAECPDKPNCISTENKRLAPISIDSADPQSAWQLVQKVVKQQGGKIVQANDHYLWATFKTPVLKFTDDVEIRLDLDKSVIHFRSASRVGYYDFNANKNRLENLIKTISSKLILTY